MNPSDTIVAISSAIGSAARLIVRMSGPRASELARAVIDPAPVPMRACLTRIRWQDHSVPAWCYWFPAPRSSTGEHVVELHLPGNVLLARSILRMLIEAGARQADPGEFTARAYFNGKIDLAQAEGVAATISAANEAELRSARQLLAGELSRRILPLTDALAEALALVEVGIDFSEEDVTFLPAEQLRRIVGAVDGGLESLLRESRQFQPLAHEPAVVLAGCPNAGKSSLLNALLGSERVVVSPVAGTTRDVIWARICLPRGWVRIVDAAGVESAGRSPEEACGVARVARQMREQAERALQAADFVVLVHDASSSLPLLELDRRPDLVVLSKCDLPSHAGVAGDVRVSAVTGSGLDELRSRLDALAFGRPNGAALALNERHLQAVSQAREALGRVLAHPESGPEIIALELRSALNFLGGIVGQVTPDDVLGLIFKGFCIGK